METGEDRLMLQMCHEDSCGKTQTESSAGKQRQTVSSPTAARPFRLWMPARQLSEPNQRCDGVTVMNPRQMNYRWACWLKSAWAWRLIDRLSVTLSSRSPSWQRDGRQMTCSVLTFFFVIGVSPDAIWVFLGCVCSSCAYCVDRTTAYFRH